MKTLKNRLLAIALIGAVIGGAWYTDHLLAQQPPTGQTIIGWRYNGSPEGSVVADKGSYTADASSANIYLKTTDNTNTGWKALNLTTFGNAFSGTAVLASGAATVTNSAFTNFTSPGVLVTSTSSPSAVTLSGVISGTVLSLASSTNTDARTVTYLIIGR